MVRRLILTTLVVLAGIGCGPRVQPIDLHDETIPIDARKLVADAEDSIEIARADLEDARRELEQTVEWKRDLLDRDWPSGASAAIQKLETMATARVRLEELEVERADEHIDVAEAKYDLITAKTAIRHDLAIYELEPLREKLRREEQDVEALSGEITAQREKVAQKVDAWWAAYKSYAKEGSTRPLYVSAIEEIEKRNLREPPEDEKQKEGADGETEEAPDLSEMVDDQSNTGDKKGEDGTGGGEAQSTD